MNRLHGSIALCIVIMSTSSFADPTYVRATLRGARDNNMRTRSRDLLGGILDEIFGNDEAAEGGENNSNGGGGDWLDEVISNVEDGGDNNETGLFDGDFGDIIENVTDALQNMTDQLFDSNNNNETEFFDDFNFTEILINITDGLKNITNGTFGDGSNFDLSDLFNDTDSFIGDILEDLFNDTDGILDGDWNFTNFGSGGGVIGEVLQDIFNGTKGAAVLLTPGLVEGWISDAVFDEDAVCTSDDSAPDCFDAFGRDGFWACRTLTNPFTGEPSSQTVCISKGQFLADNDECGCCPSSSSSSDEPECPQVCECKCDRDGTEDGGVLITSSSPLLGNMTVCVDPRYAVSAISASSGIKCADSCN